MTMTAEAAGSDTSSLLLAWSQGDSAALSELLPLVYNQLRGLARGYLRRERRDHTLETSALVHEAFLRLVGQHSMQCRHRGEFFAIAANTMRRVLIDHARKHGYAKRGAGAGHLALDDAPPLAVDSALELIALDEALTRLASIAPEQARVVELRCFVGLSAEEIAAVLEISVPTVTRRWRTARAWLYRALHPGFATG